MNVEPAPVDCSRAASSVVNNDSVQFLPKMLELLAKIPNKWSLMSVWKGERWDSDRKRLFEKEER